MAHVRLGRDPLPLTAPLLKQGADLGIEVCAHGPIIAKLCEDGKQDFASRLIQTAGMDAKPINVVVAEALAFYMAGRFNNVQLHKASGVSESSIRNFLAPDKRVAGKSGKEPSGKLTELAMLADALHVPVADLVSDLPLDERLARWRRRVADHYADRGVWPDWAPPPAAAALAEASTKDPSRKQPPLAA